MAHKNRTLSDAGRWGIYLIVGVLFMTGIVFLSDWRALRTAEGRFCQTLDFVKSQSTSFEKYNDTVVAKALRRAAVSVHQLAQDPALDAVGNQREQGVMVEGWRGQGGGLQVWYGLGNHFTLLKAPNVLGLARWWLDVVGVGEVVS